MYFALGIKIVGLQKYQLYINLLRMLAHMRFVYVRMTLISVSKDEETSTVKIRWNIVGLGMVRLVLRYFPDTLPQTGVSVGEDLVGCNITTIVVLKLKTLINSITVFTDVIISG